ncbi:hypothetical protein AFLA_014042 [Aspergillus flavus NRRL3357]|nr:hypothetical protein AFLA_014042 [Aspergillus flavus NRRL3357]
MLPSVQDDVVSNALVRSLRSSRDIDILNILIVLASEAIRANHHSAKYTQCLGKHQRPKQHFCNTTMTVLYNYRSSYSFTK